MAQNSWPFENADTTEDQYSLLFGRYGKPGTLFMGVASQPNQTGAGSLTVYGDSSGMQVKVKSGFAVVRGFAYQNTTNGQTVAIDAGSASPRIDLIVLTLDPSTNSTVLAVVKGTPAATPTAPALTQNDTTGIYQMEIGRVLVPALASVVAATDVTDTRPCLPVGAGVWTADQRPTGVQGQIGWNVTTSQLEVYTGSAWQEVAPTNIDAATITSGTLDVARIATASLPDTKLAPTITDGQVLAAQYPNFIGANLPDAGVDFYNSPTVSTSYTTVGAEVLAADRQLRIISATADIGTAAQDRVVTMKILEDATVLGEWTTSVASGKTGTLTVVCNSSAGGTPTYKVRLKSVSGTASNTQIQTHLSVLGIY